MDSFSSVFNRKTILLGCLVGVTAGVAYYTYRKWWTDTGVAKGDEPGEKRKEGDPANGSESENDRQDDKPIPVPEPVKKTSNDPGKPGAFGGLKRGFLL